MALLARRGLRVLLVDRATFPSDTISTHPIHLPGLAALERWGWPAAEFEANKADHEAHYLKAFDRAPAFAERMRAATREARLVGASVPNFFRKPSGPGWALVGPPSSSRRRTSGAFSRRLD